MAGLNLARRVRVPTDAALDRFDFFDPRFGADDAFTVKRVDVFAAEKRNW